MKNPYASTCSVRGFEDFTWCNHSFSRKHKKIMICFQWLRYQGSEFCIPCNNMSEVITRMTQIAEHFGFGVRKYSSHAGGFMYAVDCYEFETNNVTITPADIREIFGSDVEIHVTFKSLKTNNALREFEDIVDSFQYHSEFYS